MNEVKVPSPVIGTLKDYLSKAKGHPTYEKITSAKNEVLTRYKPAFSSEYVKTISEEEFRSFLLFENNKHWSGLYRQSKSLCADMDQLRESLSILVDESQPVADRLDSSVAIVKGMGKALTTAILLIIQPNKYGVWNSTSEGALKMLEVWPKFDRGSSFGQRYEKVNAILLTLSAELKLDLWSLDSLFWFIIQEGQHEFTKDQEIEPDLSHNGEVQRFGLERYLHEFLRDNWGKLEIGQEWQIYSEPGDDQAGYEFPCGVGYIDILAKHRTETRWLVIELKRDQGTDQTVGQVARYMGWVRQHLAQPEEAVEGLVICHSADDRIKYALSAVPNVSLRFYEVEFHLKEPENFV